MNPIAPSSESDPPVHSFLLPTDGSSHALQAFHWADSNLRKEDKFIILHGIPKATSSSTPPFETMEMRSQFFQHQQLQKTYENLCENAGRKCMFVGSEYHSISDLSAKICDVAKKSNASGVIIGSRGLSGVTNLLLGSLSSSVVHMCDCATIVIKSKNL